MDVRILLAFAATWLVWGSTYLFLALVVRELPPFLVSGTRNLTAGVLMFGWLRLRGAAAPTALQWRNAVIVGVLLLGVGNGAVTWSAQREPSGVVALVVSLVPLWLLVFGWLGKKGVKPATLEVVGVLLGVVGIAMLAMPHTDAAGTATTGVSLLGLSVLLMSTLSWSGGSLFARQLPPMPEPMLGSGMEMMAGGTALLLLSMLTNEWASVDVARITWKGIGSLLYLIAFGSIMGFTAYKYLLARVRPALVGTYAFVNPVVAVALGWAVLGEALTWPVAIAMVTIVTAVAMISLRPYLSRR
ncbi:MAG: EamA family transporter [Gemmatimonadaceae bacterium]